MHRLRFQLPFTSKRIGRYPGEPVEKVPLYRERHMASDASAPNGGAIMQNESAIRLQNTQNYEYTAGHLAPNTSQD